MRDFAGFAGVMLVCTLAIGLLILGAGLVGYQVEKRSCHSFGELSNREVKFVLYTPVTWDCLTPTKDGKWISTSRLRDID